MEWARKTVLFVSSSLFRFLLFFGVGVVCFVMVFGNRKSITQSIKDTNASERFVNAIIEESAKNNTNSSIPLNDPQIRKIITESFSPDLMTASSQAVINGTYDWLEGENSNLNFRVDFSQARQQLADGIAAYTFDRLRTLPTCFAVPETVDPFTIGCLPPYTDLNAEQQKLAATIAGPEGFLPKATFTQEDLPKNTQGKTIEQQFSYVPKVFSAAKLTPYVIPLILVILSVILVLLSQNKRKGIKQLGLSFAGSGVALLITPILFVYILPRFSSATEFSVGGSPTQQVFNDVTNRLTSDLYGLLINISLQLIVLGLLIALLERFTRPSSQYLQLEKKSGVISSNAKRPSGSRKLRPGAVPIQSSEESARRKPRVTKNKKYRKIPKKEI